jgi:hypothetical protein
VVAVAGVLAVSRCESVLMVGWHLECTPLVTELAMLKEPMC